MAKRPTSRASTARAKCRGCALTIDGRGALGGAAVHHDTTGHTIDVELEQTVTYGDEDAALRARGQEQLEDVGDPANTGNGAAEAVASADTPGTLTG